MTLGFFEISAITSASFAASAGGTPLPVNTSFDQYAETWLEVRPSMSESNACRVSVLSAWLIAVVSLPSENFFLYLRKCAARLLSLSCWYLMDVLQ